MSEKDFEVTATITVGLTKEDVDDIVTTALEGGITYWCRKAKVNGEYLGKYASDQISRGGTLTLYDSESDDKWELTLPKLLEGVKMWITNAGAKAIENGELDTCTIDGDAADSIVQYALFGELVFG